MLGEQLQAISKAAEDLKKNKNEIIKKVDTLKQVLSQKIDIQAELYVFNCQLNFQKKYTTKLFDRQQRLDAPSMLLKNNLKQEQTALKSIKQKINQTLFKIKKVNKKVAEQQVENQGLEIKNIEINKKALNKNQIILQKQNMIKTKCLSKEDEFIICSKNSKVNQMKKQQFELLFKKKNYEKQIKEVLEKYEPLQLEKMNLSNKYNQMNTKLQFLESKNLSKNEQFRSQEKKLAIQKMERHELKKKLQEMTMKLLKLQKLATQNQKSIIKSQQLQNRTLQIRTNFLQGWQSVRQSIALDQIYCMHVLNSQIVI